MRAKIYSPAPNTMQSGQLRTGDWILEFYPTNKKIIDPLMGWSGSKGTKNQLRMRFKTKESAIDYAQQNQIKYDLIETKARTRKPNIRKMGYAENFSHNRRSPWTH